MRYGLTLNTARLARALKTMILGAALFGASMGVANADLITGSFGVGGAYSASGDILTLDSVVAGIGTGDFDPSISFFTSDGNITNGSLDLASFAPITNVFEIGGWQLDLETLVVGQTGSVVELDGTGFVSGYDFERTAVVWGFTGNEDGVSYSMTITAVPVPAAVWLFGSGLLGLVGVARRRKV